MLVLHRLDARDVATLLPAVRSQFEMPDGRWEAYWQGRGLVAYAAEEDGELAGLALARSHPSALRVVHLDGSPAARHLLLERLVRLAGERDVTAFCGEGRRDLREALERRGFVRDRSAAGPFALYRLVKTAG